MTEFSVAEALAEGKTIGLDRLDSALLLGHALGRPRTWLIAHDETPLTAAETERWREAAARRADGVPLAYIVGFREFYGLTLSVGRGVLIPRPETEILVEQAIEHIDADGSKPAPRVVDLGTGSGAVALACKATRPRAKVFGSDASDAALAVAHRNATNLGLDVEFRAGSWWEPWAGEQFDVAVCNPPYIADADWNLAALRHEPLSALTAGPEGLAALQAVIRDAPAHLDKGSWLWLEHGFEQSAAVSALLDSAGFSSIQTHADLGGRPRCTGGVR